MLMWQLYNCKKLVSSKSPTAPNQFLIMVKYCGSFLQMITFTNVGVVRIYHSACKDGFESRLITTSMLHLVSIKRTKRCLILFIFVLFPTKWQFILKFDNRKWTKHWCYAWDSDPGLPNSRQRWIHWTTWASTWFGIIFAIVDMLHLVDIYKMLNGATNRKN